MKKGAWSHAPSEPLTQRRLLIAVTLAFRYKLQSMGNAAWGVFRVMGDKQQLRFSLANQYIDKAANELTIQRVQAL